MNYNYKIFQTQNKNIKHTALGIYLLWTALLWNSTTPQIPPILAFKLPFKVNTTSHISFQHPLFLQSSRNQPTNGIQVIKPSLKLIYRKQCLVNQNQSNYFEKDFRQMLQYKKEIIKNNFVFY